MTVRELLAVVRRRWVLVGVLLALTATASLLVALSVPLTYQATARLILEPPAGSGSSDAPKNPLLGVGGSQIVVADVVAQVVNDDEVRRRLVADGAGQYTVGRGSDLAALLDIRARSEDPRQALLTVSLVSAAVADELETQQRLAGASPATFITTRILLRDPKPSPLHDARERAAVAVLGLGTVLSLTAVSVGDSLALRRQGSRRANTDGAPPLPQAMDPRPSHAPPQRSTEGADGESHAARGDPGIGAIQPAPVLRHLPTGSGGAVWLVPEPSPSPQLPLGIRSHQLGGDGA